MIIIPKIKNLEVDGYFTFGLSKEQKKELEKQAYKEDVSIAKYIRRKLFPR